MIPLAYALPPDSAICDSMTDCVIQGVCYSTGTIEPDVDLDGDDDYCLNNIWVDCGSGCSDCCGDREKCIEHDCETNICPDLADSNEGECQTQTGRTDAWGLLRGDSITNCFINMCCGDDEYEHIYHCEIGYGITYSSPKCSSEDVCCSYDTECVYDGHCYSTEEGHLLDNTKSMNDYYSYCTSKEWTDADTSALRCSCNDCGWAVAEEIIGEYTDTTTEECCGDDPNEYYSKPCTTGTSKCCPEEGMCVDGSGNCVPSMDPDCGSDTCEDEGAGTYCTACAIEAHCDTIDGFWWDSYNEMCLLDGMMLVGFSCEDAEQCGITGQRDCLFRPPNDPLYATSDWWNEILCISSQSTQACCYFSERYGEQDVYYIEPYSCY